MHACKPGIWLVFVMLMPGCAVTQQADFYLLNALPGTEPVVNSAILTGPIVNIQAIRLPGYLDRPQIVSREGQNRLVIDEFNRWGEPLKDNFKRVFIENLAVRIAPARVKSYGEKKPFNYQLFISVKRFEIAQNEHCILKANWRLLGDPLKTMLADKNTEIIIPLAGKQYKDRVAALSKAVAALADEIANSLRLQPGT